MKGVAILAAVIGLGLGTWICVILINGMRKRIETINRRRAERNKRPDGYR